MSLHYGVSGLSFHQRVLRYPNSGTKRKYGTTGSSSTDVFLHTLNQRVILIHRIPQQDRQVTVYSTEITMLTFHASQPTFSRQSFPSNCNEITKS